jgi:hypothetical protein
VTLAEHERGSAARIPITVRVRNVPEAWRTPTAGIAVELQDGSSGLAWLPLATAASEGGALQVAHALPHAGEVVVALAAAPAFATHSYLARTVVAVEAAATIELDGSAAQVTFRLPAGAKHTSPLRVHRRDDASWLPMHGATAGLAPTADSPAVLWLGDGAYELSDPLRPEARQAFDVPKQTTVEVSAGSSRARAGRP